MNNEQATTNASTVEVEEQHHPEEAVSEAETPDVNTEADIAVQEEADSGEMAAEPTTETADSHRGRGKPRGRSRRGRGTHE